MKRLDAEPGIGLTEKQLKELTKNPQVPLLYLARYAKQACNWQAISVIDLRHQNLRLCASRRRTAYSWTFRTDTM